MAQKLINNGLPQGVFFKTLIPGVVVRTRWNDSEDCNMLITNAFDSERPKNYKGHVSFSGMDADGLDHDFQGDQIVDVLTIKPLDLLK